MRKGVKKVEPNQSLKKFEPNPPFLKVNPNHINILIY